MNGSASVTLDEKEVLCALVGYIKKYDTTIGNADPYKVIAENLGDGSIKVTWTRSYSSADENAAAAQLLMEEIEQRARGPFEIDDPALEPGEREGAKS